MKFIFSITTKQRGGEGSGNFGYSGRPGEVGGSGKSHLSSLKNSPGRKGISEQTTSHFLSILYSGKPFPLNSKLSNLFTTQSEISSGDPNLVEKQTIENLKNSGISVELSTYISDAWADDSNRSDSAKLQIAASEVLDSPLSRWQKETFPKNFTTSPEMVDAVTKIYEDTQNRLQEAGFQPDDTIILYRGFVSSNISNLPNEMNIVNYEGNALESWSFDYNVAKQFSESEEFSNDVGIVFAMEVPVRDIFSTGATGVGSFNEKEVIIRGNSTSDKALILYTRYPRPSSLHNNNFEDFFGEEY